MIDFKILVCEDLTKDIRNIKLYLNNLNDEISDFNIKYEVVGFNEVYEELTNDYDFFILDLFDEGQGYLGANVLLHNTEGIPTLVYTNKGDSVEFDLEGMRAKHSFNIEKLTKLGDGNNLKNCIKTFIFKNKGVPPSYTLYNRYDQILLNSIITIGENYFNFIIHDIKKKKNLGDIIIHRMTSGLSGAILFKLEVDGKFSILKLSKEIDKLKTEHRNAVNLYHKFPNRLINHIDSDEYYSFDNKVLGILLKEVDNSQTFFEFVINQKTTQKQIEQFLNNLYLDDQGLKNHYQNNKANLDNWTAILEKINESKILLIKKAHKELKVIVNKYHEDIDIEKFRRLTVNHDYLQLNKNMLLDDKFDKARVLSHGDLHSKNIMVQSGNHPVIIDTGSISNQYWCMDICRLIVHLFINGINIDRIEYFDLNHIETDLEYADSIINMKPLKPDGINDNCIVAINWLINNINNIFIREFILFEYQLGLMREFLQISYRFDTIPPNKRALALICANNCMNRANENLGE